MTANDLTRLFLAMMAAAAIVLEPLGLTAQPAPITINALLSMTGQAAFTGLAQSQTLSAFEKYTNANGGVHGQPIHFDILDDQSSPQVALPLANSLAARKVPVILGGTVATCAPMQALFTANGPVQYCYSPAYTPPKDSYSFAVTYNLESAVKGELLYGKLRGFKRLAYLNSTDASGTASAAIIADVLKQPDMRGLQLVAAERLGNSDLSATAQMSKIKAAQPDVLFTSASGTTFATVVRAMSDVGLDVPLLTTTANANLPQLKQMNGSLPKELYFNGSEYQLGDLIKDPQLRRQNRMFADAFKMIDAQPSSLNAMVWDSALLVLSAYRKFGASMTAQQLRTFILSQRHFPGISGYYDFSSGDQHGLGVDTVVTIGWDKSKEDFYAASHPGGTPLNR